MNRALTPAELATIETIADPRPAMTRREKLLHWAELIRQHPTGLYLMHGLEHDSQETLDGRWSAACREGHLYGWSAFGVAAMDKRMQDAGFNPRTPPEYLNPPPGFQGVTVGDAMRFFELSQQQLHEFSCDCGGNISNAEMADRIERIANGV